MDAYYLEITRGAFYLYMILLLTAAITDIWKFIIPNLISLAVIALFVALALLQPFPIPWGSHVGAAALFFAGGLLLYRFNILGAGDVKLLTALSLWAGFGHLADLLLGVALCGGGFPSGGGPGEDGSRSGDCRRTPSSGGRGSESSSRSISRASR